jgi:3-oxoacyl-[acyl-carrier protein] reductase
MTNIAEQVLVVTGGTSGIGEAFARSFGAEGASVVIAGRNGEKAQRIASDIVKAGGKAIGVTCDVTQQSDCDALIAATLAEYGRLDTVFANHGAAGEIGPLVRWSDEDVQQTVNVNLLGTLYLARAAHGALKDGGGRFIVTGSAAGRQNMLGNGMYGISKAAVSHLVRQFALEWRYIEKMGDWLKDPSDVVPIARFIATMPVNGPTGQSYNLGGRLAGN